MLILFLKLEHSHLVVHAIEQTLLKSNKCAISVEKIQIQEEDTWGAAKDVGLTLQSKVLMLECIDCFQFELQIRSRTIKEVATMFEAVQFRSFISDTEEELLVYISKLTIS
ncbi:hypothetical protein BsWGS_10481 [Bradybaena similaris]